MTLPEGLLGNIARIGPGPQAPSVVHAFIEIPKGGRNKYELDKQTGLLSLNRYLYASSRYPGDYGFVPGTHADDGDDLDVLVIVSEPTFPGCLIHARVVGVFRMSDQGQADDKILAVPAGDPHTGDVQSLHDLRSPLLREIEHFFLTYKQLEGGEIVGRGWGDVADAHAIIERAIAAANDSG